MEEIDLKLKDQLVSFKFLLFYLKLIRIKKLIHLKFLLLKTSLLLIIRPLILLLNSYIRLIRLRIINRNQRALRNRMIKVRDHRANLIFRVNI